MLQEPGYEMDGEAAQALQKSIADYGFHYPDDFVWETFETWYLTGYQVMPFAGGWNDQPLGWRKDVKMVLRIMSAQRYGLKQRRGMKALGVHPEQKERSWADAL